MDHQVTIKTIASKTNFSLTTVSRVLNGTSEKYRISKSTQDIILKEAALQGYIPNMAAKTLRNNKSYTIGLIVPSLNNPFFSKVASTLTKILFKHGFVVVISDCDNNEKEEERILKTLLSHNLSGLIAIPIGVKKNYEILKSLHINTVFIDRFFDDFEYFSVSTDHYNSTTLLMEHLIEMGHEKIACIQGDLNAISNQLRVKGYEKAIKKHSLIYNYVAGSSFTTEKGYEEMKLLINQKDRPTAVIALSDTILLGMLKAIKEENLRIPEDISVVSIDNSSYLDYLQVPITSIDQPVLEIADFAANLIIDILDGKTVYNSNSTDKNITIESQIIKRSSVKKIE
ncbi:MAG: LacI family DNA-binding transcriptional regulator [Sphingobacterium composti]